ncbi:uncharacterized protein BCR38DRAFT_398814 [Pseudomassariella vexata]|uniref:Uncharacterized protein n=1 Tax=Pseudomassariella vexata TaxID=1141098 RepID=A0A1Y2DK59_9PEZI|nr:uncharacterized protein BCR38DRAFT_398814 [Pseudomassariella vexata]ORY59612.1 hypothetical protein BCR38DRAFT_398814 [Pseudomassariella vexata]
MNNLLPKQSSSQKYSHQTTPLFVLALLQMSYLVRGSLYFTRIRGGAQSLKRASFITKGDAREVDQK